MHFLRRLILPLDSRSPLDTTLRIVQLVIGLICYGLALALMVRAAVGVAPWDVLTTGISRHVPLSFGVITVLTSFVVLLLWIPLKQKPGLGTLLNSLIIGPSADLGLHLLPHTTNLAVRIALFAAGLLLLAVATGFYIAPRLGPGPRDGLMTGLVRATRWKIWIVRTLIEGGVLLIGWLLGGNVGVGTVVFALGVGPLIGIFLPYFERRRAATIARHEERLAAES